MSWDTIGVILTIFGLILLFIYSTWRSFTSGDLREIIEFHKLVKRVNDDLFDGETKILVLNKDGKERPVKIKTINDALNRISFKTKLSKLYLSPDKERGLHLEFSTWDNDEDDFVTLIEKDGNEIIRESEINLDKMGPGPYVDVLIDMIERMNSSEANWWDEISVENL